MIQQRSGLAPGTGGREAARAMEHDSDRETPPYGTIFFDCDSTLSTIEGIDELTSRLPEAARARVRELTDAAMAGELPLERVFGERLDATRPSEGDLAAIAERYVATAVPGARETVAALHSLGKEVHIVSGGLRPAILPLADALGIAAERVHAVGVQLDGEGMYVDFERESPLARSGGKPEVVRALAPNGRAALVGDGATDLEARSALARFVCFAGVVERPAVASAADAVVRELDLTRTLEHLLTADERTELESGPHAGALAR